MVLISDAGQWFYCCSGCRACGPVGAGADTLRRREDAPVQWNRRAGSDAPLHERDALVAWLEREGHVANGHDLRVIIFEGLDILAKRKAARRG